VENSRALLTQLRNGEFTVEEFGHRVINGALWVAAVALVLCQLAYKATRTYGPPAVAFLKKTLATLSDAIPETGKAQPDQ